MTGHLHPPPADESLWTAVRRTVLLSGGLLGAAVVALTLWAALAPLENGALGQGVVTAAGDRRAVQHLEGGIVAKVLVQEGEDVTAGEALVELSQQQASASYQAAQRAAEALQATLARLDAEFAGRDAIAFPAALIDRAGADATLAGALAGERALFEARRAARDSRASILRQQIAQLHAEIGGLRLELDSIGRQLELIDAEIADVKTLLDKGLERRTRHNALLRAKADLEGQRARLAASIASAEEKSGAAELQIGANQAEFLDDVAKEQADIRMRLSLQEESLRAAGDVLERTVIRAPITGRVMNLSVSAAGAVVKPSETIAEIVPSELPLLIEARFNTIYLDSVRPGQDAQVKLLAFNAHEMPALTGRVVAVSPDRSIDERSGAAYFSARVEVPDDERARLLAAAPLSPGMPAEIVVVLGKQTVLGQMLQPLTDIIWRSFKTG